MKTILMARTLNAAFKETQLLPMLTDAMIAGESGEATFRPSRARAETRPPSRTTARALSTRLPRPQVDGGAAEQTLLAMLALSAVFCIGQTIIAVVELMPNWPMFNAWVMNLLG